MRNAPLRGQRRRQLLAGRDRREVLLRDLGELRAELPHLAGEPVSAVAQQRHRLVRRQHGEQAQAGLELRIFLHRIAQQVAHPVDELVATRIGERVDGALGSPAFARRLLGANQAAREQHLDHRVERPVAQLDAVLLVPLLEGRGHLVGVHRPLEQQRQHGERQGV